VFWFFDIQPIEVCEKIKLSERKAGWSEKQSYFDALDRFIFLSLPRVFDPPSSAQDFCFFKDFYSLMLGDFQHANPILCELIAYG